MSGSPAFMDVEKVREGLEEDGYVYLAAPDGEVDHAAEAARLGPLLPQYSGELVRDIRPLPDFEHVGISPYGRTELAPHTEWYEFPELPPRFVALWAVFSAAGEGGETTLADGYRLLDGFPPDEVELLCRNDYRWKTNPDRTPERVDRSARRPILQRCGGRLVLRFSTYDLQADDELSSAFVRDGVRFFAENHVAVKIETNAMLVWDNWRMLHSRTAFTDPRRHLRRALVGA